ncbi:epoxide hydrolase family protein [Nonomuraea jiangxiensis]|uniref:Pimeloyl-ACP methyl ester carboxylesterase n=1 Tax=Nonomuraea jiangxiensis TaxID=633440 RepID=A0A1G9JVE4_9ACTN|nr:epoxide hydrolase family protein [Nonomuraea jiangxiensis]SDL41185.1 Pimeloyl-ACP methyl ester carboxylesterase [Nonomuraea jiangxiensis]
MVADAVAELVGGGGLRPFRIEVSDSELTDLRRRLDQVRWPSEPGGSGGYGVPLAMVKELARYWRDHYDWRAWEARLNEHRQFTTTIDGTTVHFLHVRSPEAGALPLVLSHGWPGSVAEFLDVLGPLSDPRRHGLDPAIAFDLVVPSLPGFGWSGPTPDTGWGPRRIARAWAVLMSRLGYRRYGAAGNDWGARISPELGRLAPDAVAGVHVTQLFSFPDGESMAFPPTVDTLDPAALAPDDRKALATLRSVQANTSSYYHLHAQQPQTLAYAVSDSPVGLLAWNSQVMHGLDPDALLTHVSIHWLTGTAGSALRIYAEQERQSAPEGPTTVPLALAQFPDDIAPLRAAAERDHATIVSWHTYDRGGHYAARQAPDLLVDDIRGFFASLRRR